METTPTVHYHYSISSPSSPPPPANLRRLHHHQYVCRRPNLTMPLRDLTLRRITTNQNHFRFNQATQSFYIAKQSASINRRTMAEERKNNDVSPGKVDSTALSVSKIAEEQDKSTPVFPPPPEKPLPGDCCGSGCVRCVWDVYYEELEEYNKLCKSDSKIS